MPKSQEIQLFGRNGGTIVLTIPSDSKPGLIDVRINPPRENGYPAAALNFNMPATGDGGLQPRMLLELLLAHSKHYGEEDALRANYQAGLLSAMEELDRLNQVKNGEENNG